MDCVKPVLAWKCGTIKCKSDGQISPNVIFSGREAEQYWRSHGGTFWQAKMLENEMLVPCGKCPNCLARKRALMSVKLCHERSCYEQASFITLTYDEDNVPTTDYRVNDDPNKRIVFGVADDAVLRTLYPKDIQDFLKRLRSHLTYVPKLAKNRTGRDHVERIRYFCVGEYGSRTGRPHYHLIVFGWFPSDAKLFKGHDFTSAQIAKLWKHGHHLVSTVNEGACKYCAQYVTKKLVKKTSLADDRRCPEFIRQSTRSGGMGVPWFHKFAVECARRGYVTYRNENLILKSAMPQSYIRHLRKYFPSEWLSWRGRCIASTHHAESNDVIHARARLNEVRFLKSLEREVL